MKKLWVSQITMLVTLAIFIVPGLAAGGQKASPTASGLSGTAFPSEFAGTWKRDNHNNTLTYADNQLKASNQKTYWYLSSISGNKYTITAASNSSFSASIGMRLINSNLEISGDSGSGEDNWNGTWKKQQSSQSQTQQQQPSTWTAQPAQATQSPQYWTGDGGRGMRLGILVPHSQGLNEIQEYLPVMIQGVLVSNITQYSAISVLDRVSLDRVITETLDLTYEDDLDIVSLGHVTQVGYMMTGNLIKTSTGFSLQINVTDTTPQAKTIASYSGTCTAADLDNHSAIRQASYELLTQMNVRLTARVRNELSRASAQETISAQTALAQGITAQRQGTEVAALSYYLQAAGLDPSLVEAETRLKSLSDVLSSGSAGMDMRSDIQWRNQWVARLRETEEYLVRYLRTSPAYYLIYTLPATNQVEIDYDRETATFSIELRGAPVPSWFETMKQVIGTIRSGLLATGRTEAWRLNWPSQSVITPSPFFANAATYAVVVEIINSNGTSMARQTANLQLGGWFVPDGGEQMGAIAPFFQPGTKVTFSGIDVYAVENLSLRISSINGLSPERALSQYGILVLPQNEYDSIQSVIDNGLQLENLRQFDVRFDRNRNLLRIYSR